MQIATIAGNLGRDAEFKTTNDGTGYAKFSVAVSTGWGDRKATTWWDVTRWGKGAEGLAKILTKGAKVAVAGEVSTREHDGKTYLQIRADHVTIQGDAKQGDAGDRSRNSDNGNGGTARQHQPAGFDGDLDDSVPFIAWGDR